MYIVKFCLFLAFFQKYPKIQFSKTMHNNTNINIKFNIVRYYAKLRHTDFKVNFFFSFLLYKFR